MAALHPKWHLRSDDGKPPVVQIVLATTRSAISEPRLQALMLVPPEERERERLATGGGRRKFLRPA